MRLLTLLLMLCAFAHDALAFSERLSGLRFDADRIERRAKIERSIGDLESRRTSMAPPAASLPGYALDLSGRDRLLGTGKRFIRLERLIGRAEAGTGLRDAEAAQRDLRRARRALESEPRLRGSNDPMVEALARRIDRLERTLRR